jgi:NTP pyrophosphatase (non-canonical NTP hydrolase)
MHPKKILDVELLERYQYQARKGLFIRREVDPVTHCLLGLAGEVGELADAVKKGQYDPPREVNRTNLLLEAGDVLWYLTNFIDLHNFDLRQVIVSNVHKLQQRHPHKGAYSVEELLAC